MKDVTLDGLAYFQRLKSAGMPEELAHIRTNALQEALDATLIRREDPSEFRVMRLRALEVSLKYELAIRLLQLKLPAPLSC